MIVSSKSMGKSKKLSENEERILYGQVRFPLLNDRELADTLDFKMTTLTAIKNRLKKNGYISKLRIPMFNKFDCELLQVSFGSAFPFEPTSDMWKFIHQSDRTKPRCFLALKDLHQNLYLQVFKNYTEANRINDRFQKSIGKFRFYDEAGFKRLLFPYQLARDTNYFDYGDVLKQTFGITDKVMRGGNQETKKTSRPVKISKLDKKILYGLVKYPSLADSSICKKIKTTRQAVARMRKKLETEGIMKTVKIPNLGMMGYRLFVLFSITLDSNKNKQVLKEGMNKISEIMPPVFQISSDIKNVHLSAFQDFEHYQKATNEVYSFFTEKELFAQAPVSIPFSMPTSKSSFKLDYSGVIKNILGV